MPDPVFRPDNALHRDPERVHVLRGVPQGMTDVVVRFRATGGILSRRTVPRSAAESALLTYYTPQGVTEERVLSVADADAFLREAKDRADAEDAAEAAKRAAVNPTCPHCGIRREYAGSPAHLVGEPNMSGTGLKASSQNTAIYHVYRCPRCGSTEFFADGFLKHPVTDDHP